MKLTCTDLEFSYTSEKLIHISEFKIDNQNINWVTGSSGTGKSTFLSLLAGLQTPHAGKIKWDDFDLANALPHEKNIFRLKNMSYVDQENTMINHWTVKQNLDFISSDSNLFEKYLTQFALSNKFLKKEVRHLSGGERQRINFIQALIKKPRIALFDEPTSHLDSKNTEILLEIINSDMKYSTVVIVSHDNRLDNRHFKKINFESINI